jgi:hypothetical protein
MLKFDINHEGVGEYIPKKVQVQIDREGLEEKVLENIFTKFDQAREENPGFYNILKQSINMVLTFGKIDIKIPKGENALEYLVAHYVSIGLDVLEQAPLTVTGKVVEQDGETS